MLKCVCAKSGYERAAWARGMLEDVILRTQDKCAPLRVYRATTHDLKTAMLTF